MVWETTFLFSAWRKLKKSSNWHFVSAASYFLCKLQLKIFVSLKAIKSSWPQDFEQLASNKLSWPKWRHAPVFWRNILHFNTLSKVGSAEEPRSARLVPSMCWTIFAKRLWRFWAQELENVWLFVQCLKSQTFSDSCAQNRHSLLAKMVQHIDGTYCGELCCSRPAALVPSCHR